MEGVAYMKVHVLRHLKEELAWAIDTLFICIKAGLKYMQGLKYTPGSAAE